MTSSTGFPWVTVLAVIPLLGSVAALFARERAREKIRGFGSTEEVYMRD